MSGKRMKDTVKLRFYNQRDNSRKRGVEFNFTFEEWVTWWKEQLGPDWFSRRGNRAHQYVMAREGDVGPYHPSNVKCITQAENTRESSVRHERTEEANAKRSLALSGERHFFYGRKHTAKANAKRSESLRVSWAKRKAVV